MILWGPPGTGKTTLARLVAQTCDAEFIALSAVMAGVKDIRAAAERAQTVREESGRRTVLFLDEVHRFNKAQQDAFLPWVEDGTLVFIGATTENPSFELNNALLSRARVYVLRALTEDDLRTVLERALRAAARTCHAVEPMSRRSELIARAADGDARRALNMLELALDLAGDRRAAADHGSDRSRSRDRWLASLRQAGRGVLRPDLGAAQVRARQRSGCGALLAVPHARWRLRSALHRAARAAHGIRGHRQRRSARPDHGARSLRGLRAPRHARRRAGHRAGGRVSRVRREEQRGVRGIRRSHGRREERSARWTCRCICAMRRRG